MTFLAVATLCGHATADPSPPPDAAGDFGDRTLKGHTFPVPLLNNATSAFVTTHFGIREGVVLFQVPNAPGGPAGTFNLTATGLVQNFDLGIKFADWFGLYAVGGGTVFTGANVPTIISGDNSFSVNAEGGAIVRLARVESTGTQIAARFSGGGGTGRIITLYNLLASAQSDGGIQGILGGNAGKIILVPQSTVTFQGSLYAAQALTRNFGVQLSTELRQTNTTASPYDVNSQTNVSQTSNETDLSTTLTVSVDFAPNGVPIALAPEYQLAAPISGGSGSLAHLAGLGVYYSGRRDLQLGVAGAAQIGLQPQQGTDANGNPAQSGSPSLYYGQLLLRYTW